MRKGFSIIGLLTVIVGITLFFIVAFVTYQSSKIKVSVCDFDNSNICLDGEATSDLNRVLVNKEAEVLKFSRCDINESEGVCIGKSDKTSKTKWKIRVTSKSNFNIHSNYNK